MVYNMLLSYEDGVWILLSLDYNLIIEGKNRSQIIKKAEKFLKNKIKKEGRVNPVSEDKILQDLEEVDIYELIQITVWISHRIWF